MAKTNPIGVRFDKDLLEKLISTEIVTSPQKALNLFEKTYTEQLEKILYDNADEAKKVHNDIMNLGMSVSKTENGGLVRVDPLSEEGQMLIEFARIKEENTKILEQIKAIELEKIPSERNTVLGKSIWERDQFKKIAYLKAKLITPIT